MQNEEFLIKNACYSPAKYYLCKQNNKRSLLGRKQRSQVVRSFLNRYQFSCISKVTSLFSIRYTLINILLGDYCLFRLLKRRNNSPIHRTTEVEVTMINQSERLRGETLNILPPHCTMIICPTNINKAITPKPLQPFKWKALRPVAKARALNMFQNCIITKSVKKMLNSWFVSS